MRRSFGTFLVMLVCLVSLGTSVQAQTEFEVPVGGIAITGYDFDNSHFAFVCLTAIPSGTTILFTDNGWISYTNRFRTGEGIEYWDEGCYLGQVIVVNYLDLPKYGTNPNMNLSNSGDQIFVYQEKSDGSPHFIFGLHSDGTTWLPDDQIPSSASQSNLPAPLNGTPLAAIAIPEKDSGYYEKERSFETTSQALSAITNVSNWKTSDSALAIPSGDFSFTTTAVHLSEFSAETGGEVAPWWVLLGLVVVPVAVMVLRRPKRDCCS